MDKPKVTETATGADHVVRDLVDALKSLQKKSAPLSSSPVGEQEQLKPSEPQQGRSKATTLLLSLPGVSDLDETKAEEISQVESVEDSETPGFEVKSGEHGIIQGFCRSHGIIERFRVTPRELRALSNASLLGSLTCEQDVKFMLRQIREATMAAESPTIVGPEEVSVPFLLDAASVLQRAEKGSSGASANKHDQRQVNDRPPPEEGNKNGHAPAAARNGLSAEIAQPEQPKSEPRTSTGTKVAIYISIVSLVLWMASLAVLYKLADAYRTHVTTIAALNDLIGKQRQMSEHAMSDVQAQADAAKQASQAAATQADSIKAQADGSRTDADAAKTQADAAALSAQNARDMVVIAEAAHVNVDAIYCSPHNALSPDTVLTFRYRNSGRTRADNFHSSFWVGIPPDTLPAVEPTAPAGEVSAHSIGAGERVVGGTTEKVGDVLSDSSGGATPKQTLQKILAGQVKFGIWGTVTYTDVLNEKHRENFEYIWDRNFPNACLFTVVPPAAK
jgi:hypothetical protein